MWSVFDLRCDGQVDPSTSVAAPVLSWRMGSDRANAEQASCRIVVTSMLDGTCRWDTGRMRTRSCAHRYRGVALEPGETCVWFVTSWDDAGERADGAPASFVFAPDAPNAAERRFQERVGFVWTSDERLNDKLDDRLTHVCANDEVWREAVGLSGDEGMRCVRIAEEDIANPFRDLRFVQASMKSAYGLLVVRWERDGSVVRLRVSLPPSSFAEVHAMGKRCAFGAGRHELCSEV